MKKIALLVVVVAVVVAFAVPAFADAGAGCAASTTKSTCREKSLFQNMADTMTLGPGKEKNKVVELTVPPPVTTKSFQSASEYIKESSARAKAMSLRTKK
jgi:hypothetical protein